ncbi:4'-phosphopantetheinyl transferase superfamily [Globomyces pollinis-pini]|nr:4'-phosphopantetheinyl transferase superfamily [Globomyces pollinis-pini]
MTFQLYGFNTKLNETSDKLLNSTLTNLPEHDRIKIQKFYFKKDKVLSLLGRLLTGCLFLNYHKHHQLQLEFKDVSNLITRNELEKPLIKSDNPLLKNFKFNISHHGYWVVGISSDQGEIGIDVSKYEIKPDMFDAFSSTFSTHEWNWIKSVNGEGQTQRIACLWALKESYVKAIGCGITVDLDLISFILEPIQNSSTENFWVCNVSLTFLMNHSLTNIYVWKDNLMSIKLKVKGQEKMDWVFRLVELDDEHVMAIASTYKDIQSLDFNILNWSDIYQTCDFDQ